MEGRKLPEYEGRLELTWTNKDRSLLAHDDGSYEWLPTSDYRVAEVRLLDDVGQVGAVGRKRASDNLLIEGDALHALTSLIKLPELSAELTGAVKLAYIDPPFNTGQAFAQYDDALEHSVWLTMMRDRLEQIHQMLSDTGSVWVHLDDVEAHRARSVLEEVFGTQNFVATVIWQKIHARNNSAQHFSADHDFILVFAKDKRRLTLSRTARTAASDGDFWNPDDDPRGLWRRSDLTASHSYGEGKYEVVGPTGERFTPRAGRWWALSQQTFEDLRADDRLWWGKKGTTFPFRKRFQSELAGLVPTTIWPHEEVGNNREAKRELTLLFGKGAEFATPKPERLLKRIIELATEPGDLVMDCFVGSGTTAAVAHKLGRRWVAVERSSDTVAKYTLPRLTKVVSGNDPGGVSSEEVPVAGELPEGVNPGDPRRAARALTTLLEADYLDQEEFDAEQIKALAARLRKLDRVKREERWTGGGGFRHLRIRPSMFEEDGGLVFLADDLTNGRLAEATAAQLGFQFEADPPFTGRKGRSRLAVVDGVVNQDVVKLLVAALGDRERVVVCGTGIDTEARTLLREMAPGSTLRKIPSSLLDRYRMESVKRSSGHEGGV